MGLDVRNVTAAEAEAFAGALEIAAGRHPSPQATADVLASLERGELVAAFDRGEVVAGSGYDVLALTVPGPVAVPAARIMLTAVLPTHRGRGLALALMTSQLADLREREIPLAMFTTSGPGIYEPAGYSPATTAMRIEFDPRQVRVDAPGGSLGLLEADGDGTLLVDLFERHRVQQPGQVWRSPAFWRLWLEDRVALRPDGAGARFTVVHRDRDGAATGYLAYRLEAGPLREQPVRTMVVEELVPASDEARRALWAYCARFTQATAVRVANVAPDEPLLRMLRDFRSVRMTGARDFLWLRLVDVARALASRRYAAEGAIVVDLADAACPANTGRYRLEAGPDGASCSPTRADPDLVLDAAALAAAYLGATTFTTLVRAGRVAAPAPDAVARADALFASWPAPWTVTDW